MTIGPILVTGGSGQVAQALGRLAPTRDMEAVVMGRPAFDFDNADTVLTAFAGSPWRYVINAAAYTAVDAAEADEAGAARANADGPQMLATLCALAGIPVWRMLPTNFGLWQTVYWWFRRFVRRMLFRTIHDVSLMLERERAGREASPSGGVLDSQTVKAPHAQVRGYDATRRSPVASAISPSIRTWRLLMLNLTTADISDSGGPQAILDAVRRRWPWLKHPFADGAYDRTKLRLRDAPQCVRSHDPCCHGKPAFVPDRP
jgi:hypothetical protein